MHWCCADRVHKIAAIKTSQRAKGYGRVRGTERGRAHSIRLNMEKSAYLLNGIQIRKLALICCHSRGGIELKELDRDETFLDSECNIGCGYIILKIHKGFRRDGCRIRVLNW